MLSEILLGGITATVSGLAGFYISKKITSAQFDIFVEKAKAKASAIENEAQNLLNKSAHKAAEIELEATRSYEDAKDRAKADMHLREDYVIQKEQNFRSFKKNEEIRLQEDTTLLK